jgi:predicted TIM-barrel fold metal-dependent hydrolase
VINDLGDGKTVEFPPYAIDFLLDTTRAAANLVFMNVLERYPNIKFLLAHSGGFLPFAGYRMAGYLSQATRKPMDKVLDELRKFYVDLAISGTPSALPSTIAFIPYQQITYGSDYPYAPLFGVKKNLESILHHPLKLNETVVDSLFFHSANRLVEKRLQHWRGIWSADDTAACDGLPLAKS